MGIFLAVLIIDIDFFLFLEVCNECKVINYIREASNIILQSFYRAVSLY